MDCRCELVGIEGLQIQSGEDGGSGQGDSTGAFVWTAGVNFIHGGRE